MSKGLNKLSFENIQFKSEILAINFYLNLEPDLK